LARKKAKGWGTELVQKQAVMDLGQEYQTASFPGIGGDQDQ
jgi:hypothetical protein